MNGGTKWSEMLLFINKTMEPNYRKSIVPWPPQIARTEVIRPILHRNQIVIDEPFAGDSITLINANQNKGVHVFVELAKKMPKRHFLGVLPYYGEKFIPPAPSNVTWVPFNDDIRTILQRTRILLVPSYYESFCRVAVEAMINGIPVLYSKPNPNSVYPGGSTEGMHEWIQDAAIACERESIDEWAAAIQSLDEEEVYEELSLRAREHIDKMDLFTEASRIAGVVEDFTRQHPVVIQTSLPPSKSGQGSQREFPGLQAPKGPVGFGFSSGRLRIQR
jgi:glycosyltransferase involved in cell wall biosynthesis